MTTTKPQNPNMETASTFHKFSECPPEVRILIWKYAYLPRIVEINRRQKPDVEISPLFTVNREARHEAQHFGQFTYRDERSPFRDILPPWTIYFNFTQDTLAISIYDLEYMYSDAGEAEKTTGTEQVKHLLLLNVEREAYGGVSWGPKCHVEVMVELLKPMTELESVCIGTMQHEDEYCDRPGQIITQPWSAMGSNIGGKDVTEYVDMFGEQFNWLRTKLGGKKVPQLRFLCLERKALDVDACPEDETVEGYEELYARSIDKFHALGNRFLTGPRGVDKLDQLGHAQKLFKHLLADVEDEEGGFWKMTSRLEKSACVTEELKVRSKDWLNRVERARSNICAYLQSRRPWWDR